MAKVGIRDVARAAGVSITTVSHALSVDHRERVNADTRRRIEEVAARLGYLPNRIASTLRNRRSYVLGLVSDHIASSPFAGDLVLGAQDAAYERGWLVTLVDSGGDTALETRQIATLVQHQVDGILYARMYHQKVTVPESVRGVPHVVVNAEDKDKNCSAVAPNEAAAARTAVRELIDAGHRRIGFLNNRQNVLASADRLDGYRAALAEAGIRYRPEFVTHETPDVSGGREGALRLLGLADPPTGLFCFRDPQALGTYEAAWSLGLTIPEDLSVTSIDDFELISAGIRPTLSTVALPHYRMGQWGARRLLDEIETPDAPHVPELLLAECPLVRRGSVAPPRITRRR
ncbi:MAG: LacI family DNA-binding transcriptional regulator [Gordonia sp. (in: high G+C Gram-positive bacteria)]